MAFDESGEKNTDWTRSVLFTTLGTSDTDIPTGIVSLDSSKGNGSFYTLSGMKIDKMPKQKGVYIQNGRKVVVSKR